MKNLILIAGAVLLLPTNFTNGQIPPPVQTVFDPKGLLQLQDMTEKLADYKQTFEKLNSSVEFVQGFVEKLESYKKLTEVIEKLTCGTDKMEILIKAQDRIKFCDESLDLDLTILHIEHISTKLLVLGKVISMSKNESIQNLDDLVELVDEAIQKVQSINERMILNFQKINSQLRMKESISETNSLTMSGNV